MAHAARFLDDGELELRELARRLWHFLRRPGTIHVIGAAVIAGAAVGAIFIPKEFGGPKPPAIPPSGPPMANAWINTTAGASPTVCSSPCVYDSTKAFGSMNAAYTAMSCSAGPQTAYYKSGSTFAAAQTTLLKTSGNKTCLPSNGHGCHLAPTGGTWPDGSSQTADLSGCLTFTNEPGGTSTIPSISVEAPYTRILDLVVTANQCPTSAAFCTGGLCVGGSCATGRTSSFNCTNSQTGEIIVDGISGVATYSDQGANDQTAIVNSDFGHAWESRANNGLASFPGGDCVNPNGTTGYAPNRHMIFRNSSMHDYMIIPPASHNECMHFYAAHEWEVVDSTFNNCSGNTFAFQPVNNQANTIVPVEDGRIWNTVQGDPCANLSPSGVPPGATCSVIEGGGITFRCGLRDDTQRISIVNNFSMRALNFTIMANPNQCNSGGGSWPAGFGFVIAGNVFRNIAGAGYPTGITAGYNLFGSSGNGSLATGDVKDTGHSVDQLATAPASPTYNFTPSAAALAFGNFVLCTFGPSPPKDIDGVTRPSSGAACTPGPYQR